MIKWRVQVLIQVGNTGETVGKDLRVRYGPKQWKSNRKVKRTGGPESQWYSSITIEVDIITQEGCGKMVGGGMVVKRVKSIVWYLKEASEVRL